MVALTLLIGGLGGLAARHSCSTRPGRAACCPNRRSTTCSTSSSTSSGRSRSSSSSPPCSRSRELVIGTGIGNNALIFALSLAASFAIARIVEQNLLTVSPGVIEAARSMGAGPLRILRTDRDPRGARAADPRLHVRARRHRRHDGRRRPHRRRRARHFAQVYGYRQFEPVVTWAAVLLIVVFVQGVQFLGNWLARKVLRR